MAWKTSKIAIVTCLSAILALAIVILWRTLRSRRKMMQLYAAKKKDILPVLKEEEMEDESSSQYLSTTTPAVSTTTESEASQQPDTHSLTADVSSRDIEAPEQLRIISALEQNNDNLKYAGEFLRVGRMAERVSMDNPVISPVFEKVLRTSFPGHVDTLVTIEKEIEKHLHTLQLADVDMHQTFVVDVESQIIASKKAFEHDYVDLIGSYDLAHVSAEEVDHLGEDLPYVFDVHIKKMGKIGEWVKFTVDSRMREICEREADTLTAEFTPVGDNVRVDVVDLDDDEESSTDAREKLRRLNLVSALCVVMCVVSTVSIVLVSTLLSNDTVAATP